MAIRVTCPGCQNSYSVTDELIGKTIRCKDCQETFVARAAKATVAAGRADPRSQRAAARDQHGVDVEEFEPVNGTQRKQSAPAASGNNTALIVGGSIAGVTILGLIAALAFVLLNRPEPSNPTPPALPVVVHTPTPTPPASPTSDVKPSDDKPTEIKAATETKAADVKTTDTKPAETKNSTAQMVTTAQILGGVRMPRPANFKPEVVERAKKSAVMLTCHFEQGLSWGSGWVAEKNGNERYIVTNAHVVGMKEREKPKPDKIEVTFFIGTPQQRVLEGTLLALDREEDLAVVRVKGPDLPDPLPIAPSFDLRETEKLMTMGFPLGGRLKDMLGRGLGVDVVTTLKTREAPITGRVINKDGSVKYIQVEGGADPGNSGGAAVDTNGNVSAVVVAQAPGTNMKFVIPSEYVMHLLAGRILRVIPGQAVISGSTIQQPIKAFIADPLKRLRSVSVDVWPGLKPEKGSEIRPASATPPSPEHGDGPHVTAMLNFNPDQPVKIGEPYPASAELSLPALKEGEVYWFQPRYVSKDGKERWGEAVVMEMGRYPVEAKPAMIAIKHKPDLKPDDVRKLELFSRGVTGLELEGIGSLGNDLSLKAYLTEKTTLVDKNGDAKVRLKYTDLRLSDDDENVIFRKALRGVMESVKNLATDITVTRTGKFEKPKPDFAEVPQRARDVLGQFNSQIIESLEILSLVLPNKEVQPGETWSFETAYTIMFMNNKSENALFKTTCKYIGTRVRNGRPEAVIELSGSVVRNNNSGGGQQSGPGKVFGIDGGAGNAPRTDEPTDEEGRRKRGVWGVSYGAAVIDLETGLVTIARNESDIVVGTQVTVRGPNNQEANVDAFLGFYLDTLLQRGLTKEPLKTVENPATVLPNMVRVYNPLVGVGEPLTAEISKSTDVAPEIATLLRPETLRKVQKAAVLIHVEAGDGGGGSGSGWFAEPGIVVTNCHVVDMLSKSSRKPARITVVLDSGTNSERKLPGKLLTINRTDDLAVIKVEGDNLPEPLKIVPSDSLVETTRLTILGFPLGRNLARQLGMGLNVRDLQTTLKTRTTTVSGRVVQSDQSIKYVQLEGGADPGNSGGAIVDKDGNVRLVLVAGIPGTQLVFGIPSEYPARLLQGWPIEIEPDYAYLDGSTARQPVRIHFTDPVRRVGKASIDVWVGANGKPRKPTDKEPTRSPSDSVRETFPLRLEPDATGLFIDAVGEFPLPPRSAGQVYWLQPRFINGTGKEQWGQAIPYSPDGPPVERKPVVLQHKMPKLGAERTLELTSQAIFQWQQLTERHVEGYPLKATVIEKFQPPRFGVTRVQMSYKDLTWDLPLPEGIPQPIVSTIRNLLKQFTDSIKGVVTEMSITKEGLYKAPVTDYSRVPLERLLFTKTFNDQLMQSLIAMSIPFPNKEMKYRDTWEHPTNFFIETRNRYEPSLFNMKFRYLGVRDRGGRTEAVIEIEGSLAKDDKAKAIGEKELKADQPGGESPEPSPPPADPNKPPLREFQSRSQSKSRGMYGLAKGHAYIDVQSGYVAEVKLFIDVDVELTVKDPTSKQDIPVPAGGTMEVLLKRLPSAANR